jgi:integrase/recombinase XerD
MPNANHHLYKRGALYWARVLVKGEDRRVPLRTNDVRVARKERDRLIAEAAEHRAGREPVAVRRWPDAVEAYLEHQESSGLAPSTAQRYTTSLTQVSLAFEPFALDEITLGTILDYVTARRAENRSASTIRNDVTALSKVLALAAVRGWVPANVARLFDRREFIKSDPDLLDPPTDAEMCQLLCQIESWRPDMAVLIRFLRETGMRLAEALHITREDIHPDECQATLRRGVKRGRVRTITLGRAAALLPSLPAHGRLFAGLPTDSAAVSTRYGQWHRQRVARGDDTLRRWRLHDLRHAFAISSLIDDDTCLYRLMEHLGHSSVKTTEVYVRFLRGEGAQRRYSRSPDLFGSLGTSGTKSGTGRSATDDFSLRRVAKGVGIGGGDEIRTHGRG